MEIDTKFSVGQLLHIGITPKSVFPLAASSILLIFSSLLFLKCYEEEDLYIFKLSGSRHGGFNVSIGVMSTGRDKMPGGLQSVSVQHLCH